MNEHSSDYNVVTNRDLNAALDKLWNKVDARFDEMESRFHGMDLRFDMVLETLQTMDKRIDNLESPLFPKEPA